MKTNRLFFPLALFSMLLLLIGDVAQAQTNPSKVKAIGGVNRSGSSYEVMKQIPIAKNPKITGLGTPTKLYVIQLARFERMANLPSQFPKGSFLWQNPDMKNEKILMAGFYSSLEEAQAAAKKWKAQKQFKYAFARKEPFIVRYD